MNKRFINLSLITRDLNDCLNYLNVFVYEGLSQLSFHKIRRSEIVEAILDAN